MFGLIKAQRKYKRQIDRPSSLNPLTKKKKLKKTSNFLIGAMIKSDTLKRKKKDCNYALVIV